MDNTKIAHEIDDKDRTNDIKFKDIPFQKMMLKKSIHKGLEQSGFVNPTIIQANAIPLGKSGLDILVQSKSGTGKTLIFCTVLLELYNNDMVEPQSLILVPTREIAVQIEQILNRIGKYTQGFKAVCVIGGLDIMNDRKKIQGAKAIVGTPGRVLHLIKNEMLNTSKINLLILDEADKMMTPSFQSDFNEIQLSLPSKKQLICTSATFCNGLDKKLVKFMKNPLLITTAQRGTLLIGIKQFIYEMPEEKINILEMQAKVKALKNIFSKISFKQCLIFCSSQSRAESYCNMLNKDDWPCEIISGGQHQKTRLEIFKIFQNFETRILIATDLMSRGIDSENVNLVINLELPDDGTTYLHRIGRSGRFGSHGIAITVCTSEKEHKKFTNLLNKIGSGMQVLKFPQAEEYDKKHNLWDFSDLENEAKLLGIFNESSENLNNLKTTYTDYNKENIDTNGLNSELFKDINVNPNTYKIEYEHDANASKIFLTETISSLKQPSSSSNTIDDASSIAVDSDILRSNSFNKHSSNKNPSPGSFLDILIDESKSISINQICDLFDDYRDALLNNSGSLDKKPDWKNLLIDNNIGEKFDKELKDVFEEYEKNLRKKNLDEENSQKSETLNSQEPTTSNYKQKYMTLDGGNELLRLELLAQTQHFPSPCPAKLSLNMNNLESALDSDSSTLTSTSIFASSSGFDEHTSSGESSGIQTSSQSSNDSNGNEESEIYSDTEELEDTYSNCDDEYSETSSEDEVEASQNELNNECSFSNNSESNESDNYINQNAYARWTALYWHQIIQIENYAKLSSYIKNNKI